MVYTAYCDCSYVSLSVGVLGANEKRGYIQCSQRTATGRVEFRYRDFQQAALRAPWLHFFLNPHRVDVT